MSLSALFDLELEPAVERIGRTWFAADAHSLLADPQNLPEHVISEVRAWVTFDDENVRGHRPFLVEAGAREGSSSYVFAADSLRHAPVWWLECVRAWNAKHGYDDQGRRLR